MTGVERARGIETSHEHAEWFRKVFEEGPLGMALVGRDYRFLEVNEAFCRMLGYDATELTRLTFGDITHPDDLEFDVEMAKKLFAGDIPVFRTEKRYITRGGEVVCVSLTASVVTDPDGTINHCVAMVEDITSRKNLAESEARLRHALGERETLLREIHHRVKNNLQVVSSLLSLQLGSLSDPDMRVLVQESQARIGAMALVHEKLYQADDLTHIDLPAYLTSVVEAIANAYANEERHVAIDLSFESLTLDLDESLRCGLIVNELVSNAYKHAFVGRETGRITVALSRVQARRTALVVADDGSGISPDVNLETVASLGLQLVHHLALQLNGKTSIRRRRGTRFRIVFGD